MQQRTPLPMKATLAPGDMIFATTHFDDEPHGFRVVVIPMEEGQGDIVLVGTSGDYVDEVRPVDWLLKDYGGGHYEQLYLPIES